MKIVGYILISFFVVLLIGYCIVMNGLSKTTWGGWTPEEPEFILSGKEQDWKTVTEKKYDIEFGEIMLDESMYEDSIIHMEIYVEDSSSLQQKSCGPTAPITAISKSYMNIIKSERPQKYVELSFEHLWFDCDGKQLKYTTTRTFLFNSAGDLVVQN